MAMAQCASLIAPYALDSRLRGNERSLLLTPFVPAKAGTQGHAVSQQVAGRCMAMAQCASLIAPYALDSRLRGNERSLLLTPFVPAKAGTQGHAVSQQVAAPCHGNGAMRFAYCALRAGFPL